MKEMLNLIHKAIAEGFVEGLKNGEVSVNDEQFADFFYTCISNEHCIEVIAYAIASHFDINVERLTIFLTGIYRQGNKSMSEYARSKGYES